MHKIKSFNPQHFNLRARLLVWHSDLIFDNKQDILGSEPFQFFKSKISRRVNTFDLEFRDYIKMAEYDELLMLKSIIDDAKIKSNSH